MAAIGRVSPPTLPSPRPQLRRFLPAVAGAPMPRRRPRITLSSSRTLRLNFKSLEPSTFDVVVVGAGIIGLTVARQLLLKSNLSVAVVDARVPCSGATGAGQGYIWLAHKTPGSGIWDLGFRSKYLWEGLVRDLENAGMDPLDILGWKKTGSLLIGTNEKEASHLLQRVKLFSEAGLRANFLPSFDMHMKEPALKVSDESGGAFFPDDCQIDAYRTVSFIEKVNRSFCSLGRYAEFFSDPIAELKRNFQNGDIEAICTSKHILNCKKAIVIAAGAWSGQVMKQLLAKDEAIVDIPVQPRKGHLLIIDNFASIHLNHGLMEVGYLDHQVANSQTSTSVMESCNQEEQLTSISMTATIDVAGQLVLGSSRQFCGFNTDVDETVIRHIWDRAGYFFPSLKRIPIENLSSSRKVRIGLRPFMPDGKPVIGPIQSVPKVFVAAGHEGSGLSLALGTAEMIADMVLGKSLKVNSEVFSPDGCCNR